MSLGEKMKKIRVYTALLLFALIFVRGKSELAGAWHSCDGEIVFRPGGQCFVDEKVCGYRELENSTLRIYSDNGCKDYGYYITANGDIMYLGGEKYVRTQSGLERSIMEFLL